ncbi:MAG: hypothetical protein Phog2KO_25210 [Phototrophicaceae bacterium]
MNKSTRFFQLPILALAILLFFSLSAVSAQDEITCDSSVEGELDGDTANYQISVEEGQLLYVSLESEDFDTLLEVYEDDELVFSDDDGGEGLNSLLAITEAGDYELVVTSFSGGAEGEFELNISCAGSCEAVEGELDGDTAEFDFDVEEDATILALLTSDDFDTLVNLFVDGDEVASDDDSAGSLNSLLVYEVEDAGEYTLEVTSFAGDAEGEFTLIYCTEAEEVEVDEADSSEIEIIECGDTIEGRVDNEFPLVVYFVEASEGDVITINLDAADGSDLDPYLGLYSPSSLEDAETVAENDDTDGLNSEIVYDVEEDGIHGIVATRYSFEEGTSEGDFELAVSCD